MQLCNATMLKQGVLIKLICYEGSVTGMAQIVDPLNAAYIQVAAFFLKCDLK